MRLNMWQIANRLHVLEPELHLNRGGGFDIRGVRRYAADGYASVIETKEGIVCKYEEDYFILHDLSLEQGFGLILDVFDFYDSWFENLYYYTTHMDFQRIVDSCHLIFQNPLLLLDANYKVIAMSRNYGPNDVDDEWKYLCEHGFSSVHAVQYLNERKQLNRSDYIYDKPKVHQQVLDTNGCVNMSLKIISGNIVCGSIVLMQKERDFNAGDKACLRILADILSPSVGKINFNSMYEWGNSVFSKLLMNATYNIDALHMQLQYYKWKEDENYFLLLMGYKMEHVDDMLVRLLRSSVLQIMPYAVVEIVDKQIVVIINEKNMHAVNTEKKLREIAERNELYILKSLTFEHITYLHYAYNQIMNMNRFLDIKNVDLFYSFEKIATKYILCAASKNEKIYAVHPYLRKIWKNSTIKEKELLNTFRIYLENNRSLADTARELYISRNTLVYRIQKVINLLGFDIDRKENRLYILLGLEILQVYENLYESQPEEPHVIDT